MKYASAVALLLLLLLAAPAPAQKARHPVRPADGRTPRARPVELPGPIVLPGPTRMPPAAEPPARRPGFGLPGGFRAPRRAIEPPFVEPEGDGCDNRAHSRDPLEDPDRAAEREEAARLAHVERTLAECRERGEKIRSPFETPEARRRASFDAAKRLGIASWVGRDGKPLASPPGPHCADPPRFVRSYAAFVRLDRDETGDLDRSEAATAASAGDVVHGASFDRFDLDGNDRLTPKEAIPGLRFADDEEAGSPAAAMPGDLPALPGFETRWPALPPTVGLARPVPTPQIPVRIPPPPPVVRPAPIPARVAPVSPR